MNKFSLSSSQQTNIQVTISDKNLHNIENPAAETASAVKVKIIVMGESR